MAGLVPAIHVLAHRNRKDVDARDKPGHDEESSCSSGEAASRRPRWRTMTPNRSSLRGAKRRSNPFAIRFGYGLLRFARNDEELVTRPLEPVIGRAFARPVGSQCRLVARPFRVVEHLEGFLDLRRDRDVQLL